MCWLSTCRTRAAAVGRLPTRHELNDTGALQDAHSAEWLDAPLLLRAAALLECWSGACLRYIQLHRPPCKCLFCTSEEQ